MSFGEQTQEFLFSLFLQEGSVRKGQRHYCCYRDGKKFKCRMICLSNGLKQSSPQGSCFVLRQVNHKELKSLEFTCLRLFNTCDVIPDTKQKHDPYKLLCFDKQILRYLTNLFLLYMLIQRKY